MFAGVYRGQNGGKSARDEMYHPYHHRLYCETAPAAGACDCPAANGGDVTAYIAADDVTSYHHAQRPEVGGGSEHAREMTLRRVEDVDRSGRCECCQPVDSRTHPSEAERLDANQLDLLRHDIAAAAASII